MITKSELNQISSYIKLEKFNQNALSGKENVVESLSTILIENLRSMERRK